MTQLIDRLQVIVASRLQPNRRVDLPDLCTQLGIPDAPDDPALSKIQYVRSRLRLLADDAPRARAVASAYASMFPVAAGNADAFELEELLWNDAAYPTFSKRVRRELAERLELQPLWHDAAGFLRALSRLWILQSVDDTFTEFSGGTAASLQADIYRHVVTNPEDWSVLYLFERLGALDCSHVRFGRLLEALANPEVRPDEPSQRAFVACVNDVVRPYGIELAESGSIDGYPSFSIRTIGASPLGRPKNLIFACSIKPDLRLRDSVTNDIEIVTGADKVLVYDRPVPPEGLRWRDLQAWWSELHHHTDAATAKTTLFHRLRDSLPPDSPQQQLLFHAFFARFKDAIPSLPALLPEVWLHYDPKTVAQRGPLALFRQRMDFLLLLPTARIVVEVDGVQHYADDSGKASPAKYRRMVEADRELRLRGYEVYRFGGHELVGESGKVAVGSFFSSLFAKHGVTS